MTNAMMEKVENLRNMIGAGGVRYCDLEEMTWRNDSVPSISTLRKYNLLVVVREVEFEDTAEENELEVDDFENDWQWDEDRNLYVLRETVRYYGIR